MILEQTNFFLAKTDVSVDFVGFSWNSDSLADGSRKFASYFIEIQYQMTRKTGNRTTWGFESR